MTPGKTPPLAYKASVLARSLVIALIMAADLAVLGVIAAYALGPGIH